MYCDNCGQELREGAKFCPKCGTRFMDMAENMAEAEKDDPKAESTYIDNYEYDDNLNQNADFKRKKNGKSKTVLFVIIGLLVAAGIFAAVMVFLSMNSGMTPQKAYKKYFKVLQEDRGKVVDFEEKSGANGVAITDINGSGIPDVLYITSSEDNGSEGFYLHTMMDNKKDIEVDADNDLTGEISIKDTLFSTEENGYIYIRSEDGLSRRIFSKDSSGNSSTMIEMLAKRVDEESGEYVYMILTDSGYLESVDEKEYNKYIDSICGKNVTIIITSLSEEELNKQFPSIEDNISENCDDALSKLKNGDVVSVGEKDNNKSDKTESAETRSSETKAKPTEAPTESPTDPPTEPPAPTEAQKDFKQLYVDYLNNYDGFYFSGELFYINDDDIPELILHSDNGAHAAIYQLCWIDEGIVNQQEFVAGFLSYIEKSGEMYSEIGGNFNRGWHLLKFDGVSLYTIKNGSYEAELVDSKNLIAQYKIDGEEVSEEEYDLIPNEANNWTRIRNEGWTDKSSLINYIYNY